MSTWVEYKTPSTWDDHASTRVRRVVYLLGDTPVKVLPDGVHTVPFALFRSFDRIALVTIGPRRIPFDLAGKTVSRDGIAFQGEVSLELCVNDTESAISSVALHPDEQEQLVRDRVLVAMQRVAQQHSYNDLDANREMMVAETVDHIAKTHPDGTGSFRVAGLYLLTLEPCDATIREARLRQAQAIETEALELKKSQLRAQKAEQDAGATKAAAKADLEIQRLQQDQARDLELKKSEQDLKLLKQKADLLGTEAGLKAVDPKAWLELEKEKLRVTQVVAELQDRRDRDILKAGLSYQAGQNNVLRQVVGKRHGLDITDGAAALAEINQLDAPAEPEKPKPDDETNGA